MFRSIRKYFCLSLAIMLILGLGTALAEEATAITTDMDSVIVGVGKTKTVDVTLTPRAARRAGALYATSDESIATVDGKGKVTGVAVGECELTITSKHDESVQATLPVQVVIPVKKISATTPEASLHIGATMPITCTYEPDDATLQQAVYSSSHESVATVDQNGVITGVARGQTNITVTSADGSAKSVVRVKVTQAPTSIEISAKSLSLVVGKTETLKATVLPKNADNKNVIWSSSNEAVATVDSRGRVKSIAAGEAVITAACEDDPSITASVIIREVQLAKSIVFDSRQYDVIIGETTQLNTIVGPDETSDKSVTYKVAHPKIATVDENGVVTGLKGGKTKVTVTTADGSKKRATATIQVIVPVTGVSFEHHDMRVGAGSHTYVTAAIEPKDATNHHMTWVAEDESIITIKGNTSKVRVSGRKWGRSKLTGTTEDGSFTCSIYVDVGSLRHAVVVDSIEIKNGKPYIVLHNKSNMNITSVSFAITGADELGNPVRMSTKGDTLYGEYYNLAPGARTHHGQFTFHHHSNYDNLQFISIAITGWESDTGYYDHDGNLQYSYSIPKKNQEWVSWASNIYTAK